MQIELSFGGPLWALKNHGLCFLPGYLASTSLKVGDRVKLCCGAETLTAYVRALQPQTDGCQGFILGLACSPKQSQINCTAEFQCSAFSCFGLKCFLFDKLPMLSKLVE